jgi:hypothetical protein
MTPEEAQQRADRVALILSVPCGSCHAVTGASCWLAPRPDLPVTVLDNDRALFAHLARIARAVRLGRISLEVLEAQFGGELPAGLAGP